MPDFDVMRARHECGDWTASPPSFRPSETGADCRCGDLWRCDFIQADDARRRLAEAADTFTDAVMRHRSGLLNEFPLTEYRVCRAALAESGS